MGKTGKTVIAEWVRFQAKIEANMHSTGPVLKGPEFYVLSRLKGLII